MFVESAEKKTKHLRLLFWAPIRRTLIHLLLFLLLLVFPASLACAKSSLRRAVSTATLTYCGVGIVPGLHESSHVTEDVVVCFGHRREVVAQDPTAPQAHQRPRE